MADEARSDELQSSGVSFSPSKNERESKQLALMVSPLQASFEMKYIPCLGDIPSAAGATRIIPRESVLPPLAK